MTILEYAGARLAKAVTLWLCDHDAAALTGVKLALSEYREAEKRQMADAPKISHTCTSPGDLTCEACLAAQPDAYEDTPWEERYTLPPRQEPTA